MSAAADRSGPRGLFVAGTDTGVGKTFVATRLIHALVAAGFRVAAMKPVAAGATRTPDGWRNDDALALAAAANVAADYATVNPYCLAAAVSPHIAAAEAGVHIETGPIVAGLRTLSVQADFVVVEGAGGWLAPISERQSMADVAQALRLPVLLVVGLKLGCLSHAALTAAAIRAGGGRLAGWVGNAIDPHFERVTENLASLERLLAMPPAAVMPYADRAERVAAISPAAARSLAQSALAGTAVEVLSV